MRMILSILALTSVLLAASDSFALDRAEFARGLDAYTASYSRFQGSQKDADQQTVAAAQKALTEQVFAEAENPGEYLAALGLVNARSRQAPAAIADLGMKLQIRWESRYLARFYQAAERRRRLFEIPAEGILIVGGAIMGSRYVADPMVVSRYFGTIQRLWLTTAAAPVAGAAIIERRIERLPEPPANRITVALPDQLDYRTQAAASAAQRKFVARLLGMGASSYMAGMGLRAVATKAPHAAALSVVGILAGSWYVGGSISNLAEWQFAIADEQVLQSKVGEIMMALRAKVKNGPDGWLKSKLPSWINPSKHETARMLVDAVMKLQANRDLSILLAEMELETRLEEIAASYGNSQNDARSADEARAYAAYRTSVHAEIAKRGGELLDPLVGRWVARQNLFRMDLSPAHAEEREALMDIVSKWDEPLRRPALHWIESQALLPKEGVRQEGIRLFREYLEREASIEEPLLIRELGAGPTLLLVEPNRKSEALYLQMATWVRTLKDPELEFVAELLENRAMHFAQLVLEARPAEPAQVPTGGLARRAPLGGSGPARAAGPGEGMGRGLMLPRDRVRGPIEQYLRDYQSRAAEAQKQPVAMQLPGGAPADTPESELAELKKLMTQRLDQRQQDWSTEKLVNDVAALASSGRWSDRIRARLPLVADQIADSNRATYGETIAWLIARYYRSPGERDAIYALLAEISRQVRPQVRARADDSERLIQAFEKGTSVALCFVFLWDARKSFAEAGRRIFSRKERELAEALGKEVSEATRALPAGERLRKGFVEGVKQMASQLARGFVLGGIPYAALEANRQSDAAKVDPLEILAVFETISLVDLELEGSVLAAEARKALAEDRMVREGAAPLFDRAKKLEDSLKGLKAQYAHLEAHATRFQGLQAYPNIAAEIEAYRRKSSLVKLYKKPEDRVAAFLSSSRELEDLALAADRRIRDEANRRGIRYFDHLTASLAAAKVQLQSAQDAIGAMKARVETLQGFSSKTATPRRGLVGSSPLP
jgi:hypothetical protein